MSKSQKLLALDLATKLGFAFGHIDDEPIFGSFSLPRTQSDVGRFLSAYNEWLMVILEKYQPEIVVMEANMPHGGAMTTLKTTQKLANLNGHTEWVCFERKINCFEVPAATWKKTFCGTGRISKKTKPYPVTVKCNERGWFPHDDNEADALGIWTHAIGQIDPQSLVRFDPLFRDFKGGNDEAHR
jgi:Holliday junction resolvasome RuvABC endonuclease subunit